jgi:hypothetical protein
METLEAGTILSHVDFVENYTFAPQNEIQTEYFHSFQITIFVHICYRVNPKFGTTPEEPRILKDSYFYISDANDHDTLFAQHCLRMHWRWLMEHGVHIKEHVVFSDGCSGQFKACRPMYFVACYPAITNRCRMAWQFFGIRHGKGKKC